MENILGGFEEAQRDALGILAGLSEAQWRWSPSPKDWSIALCMNHINRVNSLVVPRVQKAIQNGREQGIYSPGPFRYPIFDRLFVYALEPQAIVKQSAPDLYHPEAQPDFQQTRDEFLAFQTEIIACSRDAVGLDLVRIKIASPVSERLRFSLGTWLSAVLAHERNHLAQARRVKEHPAFPKE